MSLYTVVLRFPFTVTKGPSPNHKNSPRPLFLLHQTLQLALCIRTDSVLLASDKPRLVRRTARGQSVIHHSREHVSTAPESNAGEDLHPSSRCLALHMVILGLCAAAQPWKPISRRSRRTVIVLMLLPEAVGNSVVSVATEGRRFLRAMLLSTQRLCERMWPTTSRLSRCCS
jgi:hypothetical protein